MKKKLAPVAISVIIVLIGAVLMFFLLSNLLTTYAIERQSSNTSTKLDIAHRRISMFWAQAMQDIETYEAFNQAKCDTIGYFLDTSDVDASVAKLRNQFALNSVAIVSPDGEILDYSGISPSALDPDELKDLIELGAIQVSGSTYWYQTRLKGGNRLVIGASFVGQSEKLGDLLSYDHTLSTITVGESGYIASIDLDGKFTYHPDPNMIGVSIEDGIANWAQVKDGYSGWLDIFGERYYCVTREISNEILMAVVPESEFKNLNLSLTLLYMGIFLIALSLLVIYAFILKRDKSVLALSDDNYIKFGKGYINKLVAKRLLPIASIMIVCVFLLSVYAQTFVSISRQGVLSDVKLEAVENILVGNEQRMEKLKDEYTQEYVGLANSIAWLLGQDPSLVDNDKLKGLAHAAQITSIFVFDRYGATDATNTVYTDFKLSTDPNDQSYPFWDVVKGYLDVYSQPAREDDTSQRRIIQYVGVKRLDKKGGMVQLGMLPSRLSLRIDATRLDSVLQTIGVENDGFLFAVDKNTREFTYYGNRKYIGRDSSKYGLTEAAYVDGYSGFKTIDTIDCFVTCNEYNDTLLYTAIPLSAIYAHRYNISLICALGCLVVMLFICLVQVVTPSIPMTHTQNVDRSKPLDEPEGMIEVSTPDGKKRRVMSIISRWSLTSLKWDVRTPEQKLGYVLKIIIIIILAALLIALSGMRGGYMRGSLISYILNDQWEHNVNIFSLTYIAFVIIEVMMITLLIRKGIMFLAVRLDARSETVGRLIDSFLKYISIIVTLMYCLTFVGVDTQTMIASAGILTLIVGLGSQRLISDILAGMFIVFEGEFRVGDIVTIGDWRGTVVEIGIRTTKIEGPSSNIKIFSNSDISGVINMTKQYSTSACSIGIDYAENIDNVEKLLLDEMPRLRERIPQICAGPFYNGVTSLADSAVMIGISAQCKEGDRVTVERALNREIKLLFDRNGISIPYPQLVVSKREE